MKYTPNLAKSYVGNRESYSETDEKLFGELETMDLNGKKVVDIGCGDGKHALKIKGMGASEVIGFDINEEMIRMANEKAGEANGVDFQVASGENLPIEPNDVDIIFSNFVVHYFLDSEKLFYEINRILKSGGRFIGTFNITDVDPGFEHLFNQKMPIKLGAGDSSVVVENLIKSREEIVSAINKVGLVIEKEEELDHPNAIVDESFPDKTHINKHAVMMILRKP